MRWQLDVCFAWIKVRWNVIQAKQPNNSLKSFNFAAKLCDLFRFAIYVLNAWWRFTFNIHSFCSLFTPSIHPSVHAYARHFGHMIYLTPQEMLVYISSVTYDEDWRSTNGSGMPINYMRQRDEWDVSKTTKKTRIFTHIHLYAHTHMYSTPESLIDVCTPNGMANEEDSVVSLYTGRNRI